MLMTVVPLAFVVRLVRLVVPPTVPLKVVVPAELMAKVFAPSTVDTKVTLPPVKVLFAVKLTASPKL